jgi:hypothetical protein
MQTVLLCCAISDATSITGRTLILSRLFLYPKAAIAAVATMIEMYRERFYN